MSWIYLILIILSISGDMGEEALKPRSSVISHLCNVLSIAALLSFFVIARFTAWQAVFFIIAYTAIRFSLANYIYNLLVNLFVKKITWNYLSDNSYPDKWLLKVPLNLLLFWQLISLILGVSLIFNQL